MARKQQLVMTHEPRFCPECTTPWEKGKTVCGCGFALTLPKTLVHEPEPESCAKCGATDLCFKGHKAANGKRYALCHKHTPPERKEYAHRCLDWLHDNPTGTMDEARQWADQFEMGIMERIERRADELREFARQQESATPTGPRGVGDVASGLFSREPG